MGDDRAVAMLAARQQGLVTTRQANAAGFSNASIHHRVESGIWSRVDHGVLRVSGAPFTWRTRLLACCLASGGVASHRSAAVIHGLDDFRAGLHGPQRLFGFARQVARIRSTVDGRDVQAFRTK